MNAVKSLPKPKPGPGTDVLVSPNGIRYSVEYVTPEIAEIWLTKNVDNRRLRPASIARYARDMAAGNWIEIGAGISFSKKGKLLDGQHRLHAVIQAEVGVWLLIARGLDETAQDAMDDGAKRTLADRLNFHGKQNASVAAAIVRRILMWQEGYKHNAGTWQPTVTEVLDAFDYDPTIQIAVDAAVGLRTGRLVPPTIIGLTYWLFHDIDGGAAAEFWDGLTRGAGLAEDDPRWVCRERIVTENGRPGRVPESLYLAWVIKAWNAWRKGRKVRQIKFAANEKFPEPYRGPGVES